MIIFPAIDLYEKKAVRLYKGDYAAMTVYSDDPVSVARDFEAAGATHTVLANSTTNFTAPSTKSFSKWNTKDDGSGTDYAAAATITMTADVTLYAVWA